MPSVFCLKVNPFFFIISSTSFIAPSCATIIFFFFTFFTNNNDFNVISNNSGRLHVNKTIGISPPFSKYVDIEFIEEEEDDDDDNLIFSIAFVISMLLFIESFMMFSIGDGWGIVVEDFNTDDEGGKEFCWETVEEDGEGEDTDEDEDVDIDIGGVELANLFGSVVSLVDDDDDDDEDGCLSFSTCRFNTPCKPRFKPIENDMKNTTARVII